MIQNNNNSPLIISSDSKIIKGEVTLTGSKSIANRALLIRALSQQHFDISNMSASDDSNTMMDLLASDGYELDAHHAGTTFRFLTAYLAIQGKERILTGSDRMKQRPIGPLVDALNELGCNISYLEKEGYPPLKIGVPNASLKAEVSVPGHISSQYLSALLMIAPKLANGLTLHITGDLVSRPYLEMTLSIMQYFGINHTWTDASITIAHQAYAPKPFFVEADWSAASYYYGIAALADEADITLKGLSEQSLQGDSAIATISKQFGIATTYSDNAIRLVKTKESKAAPMLEYDFIKQPDIAQTVFAMCAGAGIQGLFTGLQTLRIKETDRIAAFQTELGKVGVGLSKLPSRFINSEQGEYYMVDGKAIVTDQPSFDTYQDHRMAMALAPLALLGSIQINEPNVVSKSYPDFWNDLAKLGFKITVHES